MTNLGSKISETTGFTLTTVGYGKKQTNGCPNNIEVKQSGALLLAGGLPYLCFYFYKHYCVS